MGDASDSDLALVEPTTTVKLSAALHGVAGLVAALAGLQLVTSGSYVGDLAALNALPWSLVLLGAPHVGLALLVLRNHHPAALAATGNAAVLTVLAIAWVVASVATGLISPIAFGAVPAAAAAAVLAPFTLRSTKRGWDAKKRLRASGMDLGL